MQFNNHKPLEEFKILHMCNNGKVLTLRNNENAISLQKNIVNDQLDCK